MQENTGACCAQCLESLTSAKGELLTRVACANCQFAEQESSRQSTHQPTMGVGWMARCPECGKWCWSGNSLALHRQSHQDRESIECGADAGRLAKSKKD